MNVSKLKWAFWVSVYVEYSLNDNGKPIISGMFDKGILSSPYYWAISTSSSQLGSLQKNYPSF